MLKDDNPDKGTETIQDRYLLFYQTQLLKDDDPDKWTETSVILITFTLASSALFKADTPDKGTAYYFYYSYIATIVNERKHIKFI